MWREATTYDYHNNNNDNNNNKNNNNNNDNNNNDNTVSVVAAVAVVVAVVVVAVVAVVVTVVAVVDYTIHIPVVVHECPSLGTHSVLATVCLVTVVLKGMNFLCIFRLKVGNI